MKIGDTSVEISVRVPEAFQRPWVGDLTRPANSCQFSGCKEQKDRRVGKYDLCKAHADALEEDRNVREQHNVDDTSDGDADQARQGAR